MGSALPTTAEVVVRDNDAARISIDTFYPTVEEGEDVRLHPDPPTAPRRTRWR